MYSPPTAPRSIGGVLDDAVRLYRASFSRCWILALIGALLGGLLGLYVTVRMAALGGGQGATTLAGVAASMSRLVVIERSPGVSISYLLITLVSLVITASLIARQDAVATSRIESAGEAVGFAIRRLPSMIGAGIVWALALGLGTMLLVVPGIWLWGRLQLWLVAMVAEDIGPLKALGRSWQLIERNWWRTTTIIGVAFIIILILSLTNGLILGLTVAVFRTDPATTLIVSQLLSIVVSIFTTPMVSVAMVAMYHDLKLRREGGDLAARVSSLQPA